MLCATSGRVRATFNTLCATLLHTPSLIAGIAGTPWKIEHR